MKYPTIELSKLKPHPQNARDHTEEQVADIARSIDKHGWGRPIIISEDYFILVGHGAAKAAEGTYYKDTNGDKVWFQSPEVPYKFLEPRVKHDDPVAISYMIADNKLTDDSTWNLGKLNEAEDYLKLKGFDTTLTGFKNDELKAINEKAQSEPEAKEDNFDPEAEVEATAKEGDIWILGNNRLMCGDSTNPENIAQLMKGEKATMLFTDPPYNVDYGKSKNHPSWHIREIKNDSMSTDDWIDFNHKIIDIIKEFVLGDLYIWGASGPDGMRQRLLLCQEGAHWSATIIWKKDQLVLTPAKYQRLYEPCFYGWFEKSSFKADRKQLEVWEIPRPKVSREHPTMKPIELCAVGIKNSSYRDDLVLDLFGGSGSTLIACEQLQRRCNIIELDAHYCDVIINRWQKLTGQEAYREE